MSDTHKITKLLNDSLAELNVKINAEKELDLVEFCLLHTNLRGQNLVTFCEEFIEEFPSVIISEDVASQIGQNLKDAAHYAAAGNSLGNETRPTASGIRGISQKIGNFMGTTGANVRNSAIIQTSDGKNMKYLLFPDIDPNRPGHMRVLNALKDAEEKATGQPAEIIQSGDARRQAIQSSPTEVRLADKIQGFGADKAKVVTALNNLSNYANQQKLNFTRYGFIAPEEISPILQKINTDLGSISNIQKDLANIEQPAALAQSVVNATTNTQPQTTNAVSAGMNAAKAAYAGTPQPTAINTPISSEPATSPLAPATTPSPTQPETKAMLNPANAANWRTGNTTTFAPKSLNTAQFTKSNLGINPDGSPATYGPQDWAKGWGQ